jgi:hypothetical protein
MASALKLGGVDAFLAELTRLAPELASEAASLQAAIAEQAATTLRAAYPSVTGGLRASVEVQREGSASPARVFTRLVVTAPYAGFVEFGTSRTAPRPSFVPISRRSREDFVRAVIARVKARGLGVTGEAR